MEFFCVEEPWFLCEDCGGMDEVFWYFFSWWKFFKKRGFIKIEKECKRGEDQSSGGSPGGGINFEFSRARMKNSQEN